MRPHPWDSPGKNTGVGCHFFLQCIKVKSESEVAQSCPTLRDPMDCSLPGSSVHGIFPGKSTGVGCHCLLQSFLNDRFFSDTQHSNPDTYIHSTLYFSFVEMVIKKVYIYFVIILLSVFPLDWKVDGSSSHACSHHCTPIPFACLLSKLTVPALPPTIPLTHLF